MNCEYCSAPVEEPIFFQKYCPKCKANFFIGEEKNLNFIGEAIKDNSSKIITFSLKQIEVHLDKSLRAEDFYGFYLFLCPFCSQKIYLKNICSVLEKENGFFFRFPQKEKKEIECLWCGKKISHLIAGENTFDKFIEFKKKSEFEKNLEKFLSQPPIEEYTEKKGCLSILLIFPFFK